jgi:hypothetical protein
MEKLYIVCYLTANELEDIRVSTNFDVAMKVLEKSKKSKQVLEYNVVEGITEEIPVCSYYYKSDVLVKHNS